MVAHTLERLMDGVQESTTSGTDIRLRFLCLAVNKDISHRLTGDCLSSLSRSRRSDAAEVVCTPFHNKGTVCREIAVFVLTDTCSRGSQVADKSVKPVKLICTAGSIVVISDVLLNWGPILPSWPRTVSREIPAFYSAHGRRLKPFSERCTRDLKVDRGMPIDQRTCHTTRK